MESKPTGPDQAEYDPVTTKQVIENIAKDDDQYETAVEPKVHPCGIGRPEASLHPSDEPPVHRSLIDDMDYKRRKEGPQKNVEAHSLAPTPGKLQTLLPHKSPLENNNNFC
jgi:hypothetical protein